MSESAVAGFARSRRAMLFGGTPLAAPDVGVVPVSGLQLTEGDDAAHLHVLSRRRLSPARQHAVPLGVRRQRRGCHGPRRSSWSSTSPAGSSPASSTRVMLPDSELPLIGASGAVAGVIAAYLMLHPRVARLGAGVQDHPAADQRRRSVLGVWIAFQVVMVSFGRCRTGTAWWAHIGGLIAGALLWSCPAPPGRSTVRQRITARLKPACGSARPTALPSSVQLTVNRRPN